MAEALSNTSQGCATFHFVNVSKRKVFEGPRTDQKKKKKVVPTQTATTPEWDSPTEMRSSILSIPPHPCNSHCSFLTSSRALVFSSGQRNPTQLQASRRGFYPPEFCAVGAELSWAGSWMSPRAPRRDLAASWQQLPTGSLELLTKMQPNRMLLTPM